MPDELSLAAGMRLPNPDTMLLVNVLLLWQSNARTLYHSVLIPKTPPTGFASRTESYEPRSAPVQYDKIEEIFDTANPAVVPTDIIPSPT